MKPKAKAIPKKTNKQVEELLSILQYFRQHQHGAALCIPVQLVGDVEAYTHTSNGKLPKNIEKINIYNYLSNISTLEKSTPSPGKKKSEQSFEIPLYTLNQEGENWLHQYEQERQEEQEQAWREKMESTEGLQQLIEEHNEQVAALQHSLQQTFSSFDISMLSAATNDFPALLQRLQQWISHTQQELVQEWTRQFQESMEAIKQQFLNKVQEELDQSSQRVRELNGRIAKIQSEIQQLTKTSAQFTHIVEQVILVRSGGSIAPSPKTLPTPTKPSPAPSTEMGLSLTWLELCQAVLDLVPSTERISLPDLHDKLHRQGVSIRPGLLQDVVLALSNDTKLTLSPWSDSMYEIPRPHFVIMVHPAQFLYFVQKS